MNAFFLSLRYIRSRKLESALALGGIILGVASLAGTLSLIKSYSSYYDAFSKSPEARQITVMQSSRMRVEDEPAVLIGESEIENIRFTSADAQSALEVCDDVLVSYEVNYAEFRTSRASTSSSTNQGWGASRGMNASSNAMGAGGGGAPQGALGGGDFGGGGFGGGSDGTPPDGGDFAGGGPSGDFSGGGEFGDGGPGGDFAGGSFDGEFTPINFFNETQMELDSSLETPLVETVQGAYVSGGFFTSYNLKAEYGDVFTDTSDNSGTPALILGASIAQNLFESSNGGQDLIGKKIVLNNTSYLISGILEPYTWSTSNARININEIVFVPSMNLRSGFSSRAQLRNVTYSAKEDSNPAQAAIQLENYFNSLYGEESVIAVANLDMFRKEITKRQKILALMTILASASALTAAINLFNLMTSRVLRRKKHIAIMRAIGAWNQKVFGQIMLEAGLIGISGAIIGLCCSPIIIQMLSSILERNGQTSIPVSMQGSVLVLVTLGTLAVSLLFAAVPAKSGSSLVITDALRSE